MATFVLVPGFWLGGWAWQQVARELRAGGTWLIPPNVPHEVLAGPEGAVVIDVFSPVREDWAALERLGARTPRWP